jgi:hypothetical protein
MRVRVEKGERVLQKKSVVLLAAEQELLKAVNEGHTFDERVKDVLERGCDAATEAMRVYSVGH